MARTKSLAKRSWCLPIAITFIILIIIAIAVPLAVILPKRKHHQTSAVLIPLYIYPSTNTSWSPLYDV